MNGSTVKKPHLIQNGILIQCNTENFVPIVVPDLSTSSSFHLSFSMTSSKQEIHYPTSSSSSYSSHTTTASSDSETREREDQKRVDSHPLLVKFKCWKDDKTGETRCLLSILVVPSQARNWNQVKRKPRWNGETRCLLPNQRRSDLKSWSGCKNSEKYLVDDKIPAHGDSHSSVSHEKSLGPVKEPKLQGAHAEDAMAEP